MVTGRRNPPEMEMPVQVVEANPQVANDAGRVAIQHGPLVYCMEEVASHRGSLRSDSIAQCSVLPIQQPSGAEPTGAADVYSLVCMVQPAADGDAGLDSSVQSLMRIRDNAGAVEHLR
jgi:DUF1680 family protein